MRTNFAFGKTGLTVDLPEGPAYHVLEARWASAMEDPAAAVADALDHPIGCPALEEVARGCRSAAISVCDITRPAPNRLTLPLVLERLARAGIANENITILIATGLHRPATEAELIEILGPEVAATYPIVNHNARNLDEHRYLGQTESGTPVYVAEAFVAADLRITLGFIEQHLMAGFSGGRKLIAPGIAGQDTIKTLHSPRFMRDTRAVEGSIQDNPLHRELVEIARLAGHSFSLDVVLTEGRRVASVFAGHPEKAHLTGTEFVRKETAASLPVRMDAAITSAAGYPLDLTFYQVVKGITAASHLVKPGGVILLMGACEEGPGAEEFSRMLMESADARSFLDQIEHSPVTIDQWQLEKLALVCRTHEVWFYTPGLPDQYRNRLWGRSFATAAEALEALAAHVHEGAPVAVIPEGPYVFARCEGSSQVLETVGA